MRGPNRPNLGLLYKGELFAPKLAQSLKNRSDVSFITISFPVDKECGYLKYSDEPERWVACLSQPMREAPGQGGGVLSHRKKTGASSETKHIARCVQMSEIRLEALFVITGDFLSR